MISFQIEITGLDVAVEMISRLRDLTSYADPAIRRWLPQMVSTHIAGIGNYPAHSGWYERTGNLGSSYQYSVISSTAQQIVSKVINTADYASFVIGESKRWAYWWTLKERIEEYIPDLVEQIAVELSIQFGGR